MHPAVVGERLGEDGILQTAVGELSWCRINTLRPPSSQPTTSWSWNRCVKPAAGENRIEGYR